MREKHTHSIVSKFNSSSFLSDPIFPINISLYHEWLNIFLSHWIDFTVQFAFSIPPSPSSLIPSSFPHSILPFSNWCTFKKKNDNMIITVIHTKKKSALSSFNEIPVSIFTLTIVVVVVVESERYSRCTPFRIEFSPQIRNDNILGLTEYWTHSTITRTVNDKEEEPKCTETGTGAKRHYQNLSRKIHPSFISPIYFNCESQITCCD